MTARRDFLRIAAAGLAGVAFVGCDLFCKRPAYAQARRKQTMVNGRRVKVIDVHAHCAVPEAMGLIGMKIGSGSMRPDLVVPATLSERIGAMDAQGIDVEALSINAYWYNTDRDLAKQICQIQNEKLAEICATHPDRFVAFASVALQHPDLAAEQLEQAVKKYHLRGAAIGGSVGGEEISNPKFDPFWAKVQELGVPVFIHPQTSARSDQLEHRLRGNGYLENVIGNPLETTIALSHLIFDATLDRFPALKIVAAHGGGYLPSYAGRSDLGCPTLPSRCAGGAYGGIKQKPSEYLKRMYYDTMVFTAEGLRHLMAEVGASQLMVGTDYPYPWTKSAVEHVMQTPGLSDADRIAILEGNAAKLLGISA